MQVNLFSEGEGFKPTIILENEILYRFFLVLTECFYEYTFLSSFQLAALFIRFITVEERQNK